MIKKHFKERKVRNAEIKKEFEKLQSWVNSIDLYRGSLGEYERIKGETFEVIDTSDYYRDGPEWERLSSVGTHLGKKEMNLLRYLYDQDMVALVNYRTTHNDYRSFGYGTPIKKIKTFS